MLELMDLRAIRSKRDSERIALAECACQRQCRPKLFSVWVQSVREKRAYHRLQPWVLSQWLQLCRSSHPRPSYYCYLLSLVCVITAQYPNIPLTSSQRFQISNYPHERHHFRRMYKHVPQFKFHHCHRAPSFHREHSSLGPNYHVGATHPSATAGVRLQPVCLCDHNFELSIQHRNRYKRKLIAN